MSGSQGCAKVLRLQSADAQTQQVDSRWRGDWNRLGGTCYRPCRPSWASGMTLVFSVPEVEAFLSKG